MAATNGHWWCRQVGPIQDGIPLPPVGRHGYQWKDLKVNQSFLVRCDQVEKQKLWNTLSSCKNNAQKRLGFTFELRAVPAGIRVWRTA